MKLGKKLVAAFILLALLSGATVYLISMNQENAKPTKLYWFIPDGMRADPQLINVYRWAQEGKLPNIKKMMDNGAYGYSVPDFPSHTPVNFASLLTGAHPAVHGVSDGPMRIQGNPLLKPSLGGFWSSAKKVSPIWTVLENADKKVACSSIPNPRYLLPFL